MYVGGFKSSSLAVVDVSDPSHPLLAGALVDGQNLDAPIAIALSPDGRFVILLDVSVRRRWHDRRDLYPSWSNAALLILPQP